MSKNPRIQKTPKNKILSLVDHPKFIAKQAESDSARAKQIEGDLVSYKLVAAAFQFQTGDELICRKYLGEDLFEDTLVIGKTKYLKQSLTTVANASKILAVVVAFKREVIVR